MLGGRPIREPVAWAGPFVMNTRAEVMQAYEDFQKGRLGTIPSVHGAPTTLQEADDATGRSQLRLDDDRFGRRSIAILGVSDGA